MKKKIPPSIVSLGHQDYDLLSAIMSDMEARTGPRGSIKELIPPLYRREIDSVIKTSVTGRRSYGQLEKVELTYIGTLVEMMLRSALNLPRSPLLDTHLAGVDVDIKHTMGSGWMIPTEAIGHPCILSAADEKTALCYLGLVVARPEYLRIGVNKDKKTSLRAEAWKNILWFYTEEPYPHNFWRNLSDQVVDHIFDGQSGNERMRRLFQATVGVPVTREAVEAVGRQKDPTRRARADNKKGTRDKLSVQGIFVLSKEHHRRVMISLGLPVCDFIAFHPSTKFEWDELKSAGIC